MQCSVLVLLLQYNYTVKYTVSLNICRCCCLLMALVDNNNDSISLMLMMSCSSILHFIEPRKQKCLCVFINYNDAKIMTNQEVATHSKQKKIGAMSLQRGISNI